MHSDLIGRGWPWQGAKANPITENKKKAEAKKKEQEATGKKYRCHTYAKALNGCTDRPGI